jgi:branched-chain amino acid transport system substrate-binding protein
MIALRTACRALLLVLWASAGVAHAADGELTIGFVSPVTGNFAELGTAMRNGGQYAVDAVNAAGGLKIGSKTYTLKYVVGDTEGSAERAISAARRLIDVEHVHAIIGYALATDFLASMQLLQESKVPTVDTSGRADSIPERIAANKMDYMFQLSPTNRDFVVTHGELMKHYANPRRAVMLAFNTDFAREYTSKAEAQWPKMMPGLDVRSVFVEGTKMDLQPELLQIRRFDPQFLFLFVTGVQTYQFVDQFAASGLGKKMLVLGDSIYGSEQFRTKVGDAVDFHMANAITERRPFSELTLPFYDGYKARWGFYPPFYAVQTYDGALMVLEAMRRAKITGDLGADRTAIRDGLASIDQQHPMTGARGSLSFSSLETGRTVPIRKIITQYQPGNKTVIVWPLDQAGQFIDPRK